MKHKRVSFVEALQEMQDECSGRAGDVFLKTGAFANKL